MPDPIANAVEEKLKDLTGASVSQIRYAALSSHARDFNDSARRLTPIDPAPYVPPTVPKIEVLEQSFHPRPFTVGIEPGGSGGGGSGANTPPSTVETTPVLVFVGPSLYKADVPLSNLRGA